MLFVITIITTCMALLVLAPARVHVRTSLIVLMVAATLLVAVTALSVARRTFAACQDSNTLDELVQVTRGYDLAHNTVICNYKAASGRRNSSGLDAWTVLQEFSPN